MAKRARPDIHQTGVVLSTRVKEPNDTDCKKFVEMIEYLNGTKESTLL